MTYRPPPKLPPIEEIERILDWPTDRWRGQCYAVACAFVEHGIVEGKAVYGYYTGPVSPDSVPFGVRHALPFHHHGWVVTPDGWIIDPTRWVFEDERPYIHVFEPDLCDDFDPDDSGTVCQTCDHIYEEHVDHHKFFSPCSFSGREYDQGGDRWREDNETPRPESTPEERTIHLLLPPVSDALQKITTLLHRPDADAYEFPLSVSVQEGVWLANLSTLTLGSAAGPLYRALEEADCGGFIPIDNRRMILEESPT